MISVQCQNYICQHKGHLARWGYIFTDGSWGKKSLVNIKLAIHYSLILESFSCLSHVCMSFAIFAVYLLAVYSSLQCVSALFDSVWFVFLMGHMWNLCTACDCQKLNVAETHTGSLRGEEERHVKVKISSSSNEFLMQ